MGRRKGLAEEIAGLEDNDQVEDELKALKAKIDTADNADKSGKESKDA
jgi:hypothetical protein